jgi:hypothetical protein
MLQEYNKKEILLEHPNRGGRQNNPQITKADL